MMNEVSPKHCHQVKRKEVLKMSIEAVKSYFAQFHLEDRIQEFPVSSATVELAAQALHTQPGRIAKTLSFLTKEEECILILLAGDKKIDNHKFKETFGMKAKMPTPEQVAEKIGHSVGGVCPFAVPEGTKVYLDQSLREHETVFPACGSSNSAIELSCEELARYANAVGWVDVSKD